MRRYIAACEAATGVVPYSDRARNVALAHTVLDMSYNEVEPDESCSPCSMLSVINPIV